MSIFGNHFFYSSSQKLILKISTYRNCVPTAEAIQLRIYIILKIKPISNATIPMSGYRGDQLGLTLRLRNIESEA